MGTLEENSRHLRNCRHVYSLLTGVVAVGAAAAVAAAAAKWLQSFPTLCYSIDEPTRRRHPWDSPGKNTGVGCHFLLQCMKVKSESGGTQSCPTPSNPMDHSPPGSSVHGIFQARVLEWVAIAFSELKQQTCCILSQLTQRTQP